MVAVIPKTSSLILPTRTFIIRLVAWVLLINLFVFGLAGFSLYRSRTQYESRVAIQTQNLSQSLNLTIDGIIDNTSIALLSVEREMERQIKNGVVDSQSMNEYILEQKGLIPELDGLRIANVRGEYAYGDKVVSGTRTSIADRDYFIYAKGNPKAGLIISKPMLARSSQKWVINIVRRINNPDGTFAGVVCGAISLDYLSKLFSSFDLGKHGIITLRDGELAVIVRYPEPPGEISSIGRRVLSRELRALTQAGKNSATYKNPGVLDSIERTFSYNKISNYPLYVTVGLATNDYLAPWRNEAKIMLMLVSLFTSGSLVSAWVVYRNRKREKMTEAELTRYREHLEKTVLERTSELEGKNIRLAEEIIIRKRVEADLKKAAIIMDKMSDSVTWISKEGRYLYVNDAACSMNGYTREEMLSMSLSDVAPHYHPDAWQTHWEELKREGYIHFETVNIARDGHEFPVEVTANYLNIDGMEYNCSIVRDMSEHKEAEAEKQNLLGQLSQSQKIESVGRLAGGIAHDFNNLLTPILGYSELLKRNIAADSHDCVKVDSIIRAADKARILTQQLLSFSRKQILDMKTIDMNNVVTSFHEILRRTIRENIDIQLHLTNDRLSIRADKNQLEQIIMNLAVNAQDAIKGNGIITIETSPVTLDDEYVRQHAGVTAGKYLMLAVTDSGSGMDKETLSHMFEPFFTTKGIGEGSGLGLATVYGLVKQHAGYIWVYSEKGKGSAFKIYFPIVEGKPFIDAETAAEQLALNANGRTILLVEDNEMVRKLVHDLLLNLGFTVMAEEGPKQALMLREDQHIDLLVTDVVMPDMTGPELHQRLLKTRPGLKVLFMSGYTNNSINCQGVLDEGINFIQKPFAVNDLAKKVDAILNGPITNIRP